MYDLVIIGSGPAGLSAAVYAKRACLDVVVLEKEPMGGGQMIYTQEVDNYLGLPETNGFDLARQGAHQVFEQRLRIRIGCVVRGRHRRNPDGGAAGAGQLAKLRGQAVVGLLGEPGRGRGDVGHCGLLCDRGGGAVEPRSDDRDRPRRAGLPGRSR